MTNRIGLAALLAIAGGMATGCGSNPGIDYNPTGDSPELQYAKSVKSDVRSLQTALRTEGIAGLQMSLQDTLESMESLEEEHVGEHLETYQKIRQGLKDLKAIVDARKSTREISQKIDELIQLSDTLPGELEEAPAGDDEYQDPDDV